MKVTSLHYSDNNIICFSETVHDALKLFLIKFARASWKALHSLTFSENMSVNVNHALWAGGQSLRQAILQAMNNMLSTGLAKSLTKKPEEENILYEVKKSGKTWFHHFTLRNEMVMLLYIAVLSSASHILKLLHSPIFANFWFLIAADWIPIVKQTKQQQQMELAVKTLKDKFLCHRTI